MLKVEIELNERENGLCAPCLVVSEDSSDETCVIVLPEDLSKVSAVTVTDILKKNIIEKYESVVQVSEAFYGAG